MDTPAAPAGCAPKDSACHEDQGELYAPRKERGQVFTPPGVSRLMAGLFTRIPDHFRLLDPGAGVGPLAAAVCEQVLSLSSPRHIEIVLYENDATLLQLLEENMRHCRAALTAAGHEVRYTIHDADFILTTQGRQAQRLLFDDNSVEEFDAVIMNPPYFKIGADSARALAMADVFQGQTNITSLWKITLTTSIMRSGSSLPMRCSGLPPSSTQLSWTDTSALSAATRR